MLHDVFDVIEKYSTLQSQIIANPALAQSDDDDMQRTRLISVTRQKNPNQYILSAESSGYPVSTTIVQNSTGLSFIGTRCGRCETHNAKGKPCSHLVAALLRYSKTDTPWIDWLGSHRTSEFQSAPAIVTPCLDIENGRLVCHFVVNGGTKPLRASKVTDAIALYPSGPDQDALVNLQSLLNTIQSTNPDADQTIVPDHTAGTVLLAACKCAGVRYSSKPLQIEAPTTLDYDWTSVGHMLCIVERSMNDGRYFHRGNPPVHLSKDGVVTPISLPPHISVIHAEMLDTFPGIALSESQEQTIVLYDKIKDFPLPPPPEVDAQVIDDKRLRFILQAKRMDGELRLVLSFRYYRGIELVKDSAPVTSLTRKKRIHRIFRNQEKEAMAIRTIESLGFKRLPGESYEFDSDAELDFKSSVIWARMIDHHSELLIERGWIVKKAKSGMPKIIEHPVIHGRLDNDPDRNRSYKIPLDISADGEPEQPLVPLIVALLEAYPNDQWGEILPPGADCGYLPIQSNGAVIKIPATQLRGIIFAIRRRLDHVSSGGKELSVPLREASVVEEINKACNGTVVWSGDDQVRELLGVYNRYTDAPLPTIPNTFRSTLDPHQLATVGRLAFFAKHGLSTLLCDDMGIGKTVQMLALHAITKAQQPNCDPWLVLAPHNGLQQWQKMIKRHYPSVQRITVDGTPEQRIEQYAQIREGRFDIVITNYHKLEKDLGELCSIRWNSVVVDEAHNLKKRDGKWRSAIATLDRQFIYPVTGTPIENNLSELWSHVDLALPGYLGKYKAFRKEFCKPIEIDGDQHALRRLLPIIQPIICRKRTSDPDVKSDVPEPRIIQVDIILKDEERALYETVRAFYSERIKEILRDIEWISETKVVELIRELRQIAAHPGLYAPPDGSNPIYQSAKQEALAILLKRFHKASEPTVVFSYSREIIKEIFIPLADALQLNYGVIHGEVNKDHRPTIVEKYLSGAHQVLFTTFGTMKESIDLPNTRNVILNDPGWNPQVERQAIGRAVRRGQKHIVNIYRMLAVDTIEEALIERQQIKLALVDAVFEGNIEAVRERIPADQVRRMFER